MVEEKLSLEPEVQEVFQIIEKGQNFLLSGGAGSGKTYSLVQVIKQVIFEHPSSKIACMTYTNAAVKEIEERVNHSNLNVSTIHDFLWDNIKHFQEELKSSLIHLINDEDSKISTKEDDNVASDYFDHLEEKIQYKEYVKIKEGIISHDELLILSNYLFKKYPKLCQIVQDKFQYIFVDEYQDTNRLVIEIFLESFRGSNRKSIVGFFGDAMQSIYDDGIGDLNDYLGVEQNKVKEIKKEQNRRCPSKVIGLANKLRFDGIVQQPSTDANAPNMSSGQIREGQILFLYSTVADLEPVKRFLKENRNWDFNDSSETKELNLTHNLIAGKAGFRGLMDIYDRDPVIKLKNDILKRIKDNKKKGRPEVPIAEDDTFDQVVDRFELKNRQGQLKKEVLLENSTNRQLYDKLKDRPFSEVRRIYVSKDSLIDDKKQNEDDENKKGSKRDRLIKHLFKIQNNITLYQRGKYNEFLRATDYRTKIRTIADKRTLKNNIEDLVEVGDKTIEQVISEADEKGICLIDDHLATFRTNNEYLYDRVKSIEFKEFQYLYDYLEGKTPFSTQHKTKGTEFDNVLVILDNGGWYDYNFEKMFLNTGSTSVLERSRKIFYVCCTRAKENLAVFYHDPSPQIIAKAKDWFGEQNCLPI